MSATDSFNWTILIAPALGILGGAASNLVLRLWQYRREHWSERVKWFCESLGDVADMGAEYWCRAGTDPAEDRIREARILGYQARLDGLSASFLKYFPSDDQISLSTRIGDLRLALTGGDFQSLKVAPDVSRALEVQDAASLLIVDLMIAADQAVSVLHKINNLLPKRYPEENL